MLYRVGMQKETASHLGMLRVEGSVIRKEELYIFVCRCIIT